jgi:trehalose 2-sulfotransferase
MEWKEQFDSALDFPEAVDPSVKYAICSTPRSGSHMLGQLLYATGKMGCPLEYFNPGNLVRWQARAQVAGAGDLIRFLQGIRTSPNGCFGVKAHFTHVPALAQYIPLGDFVTRFTHVHIVRRDLLAQAISFARATQTGQWISRTSASDRTATYDGPLIRRCLVELARQHASWEHLFHGLGLRPLVVEYESLAADPPRVIRNVASFVGINLSAEVEIPGPRTSRQRDSESESWRDRFVAEMGREPSLANFEVLQHFQPPKQLVASHSWKRWLRAALHD